MIIGFIYLIKNKNHKKDILLSFGILFLLSFVFTFGPFFQGWNNPGSTDIKLPYSYLYEYIPFFKGIRAPTRFQYIFYVPFSLFVAFGYLFLKEKVKNVNLMKVLFLCFMAILFIENFNREILPTDHQSWA